MDLTEESGRLVLAERARVLAGRNASGKHRCCLLLIARIFRGGVMEAAWIAADGVCETGFRRCIWVGALMGVANLQQALCDEKFQAGLYWRSPSSCDTSLLRRMVTFTQSGSVLNRFLECWWLNAASEEGVANKPNRGDYPRKN